MHADRLVRAAQTVAVVFGGYCADGKVNSAAKIRVLEHGKSYEDFSISIHKGKWTKNYVARLEDENVSENVPVRLTIYKRNKRATRHVTFKASANVSVTVDKKRNMLLLDVHDTVLYTDGTHRYNTDLPEWFDKP